MSVRQQSAEERLKAALAQFESVASCQLKHIIGGLESDVSTSIQALSITAIKAIRDVKSELSLAEAIRRRPLNWAAGAAALGALAGAAMGSLETRQDKQLPRWPLVLADAGMALLKAGIMGTKG